MIALEDPDDKNYTPSPEEQAAPIFVCLVAYTECSFAKAVLLEDLQFIATQIWDDRHAMWSARDKLVPMVIWGMPLQRSRAKNWKILPRLRIQQTDEWKVVRKALVDKPPKTVEETENLIERNAMLGSARSFLQTVIKDIFGPAELSPAKVRCPSLPICFLVLISFVIISRLPLRPD